LPSRFIDELPEAHVEVLTAPGIYGGGYGGAAGDFGGGGMQSRMSSANTYNSPGWKRMQDRSGERGLSQPRESRSSIIDLEAVSIHSVGDRVFHQKFGYGEIMQIEGDKLVIEFDKAGEKKLVAKFVSAADDVPF
jgi:DNA helicase-2/ATP-dependent DNA helicase PcrA